MSCLASCSMHADLYHLGLLLETDGSHAACKKTRRGTSGYLVYLVGPAGSRLCFDWACKGQTAESLSAGETELFAIVFGTKAVIRSSLVLNFLGGFDHERYEKHLESDSTVALSALRRGASDGLRHVRRTAGISIAWLHRVWCVDTNGNPTSKYTAHRNGKTLGVDALTKAVSADEIVRLHSFVGLTPT